MKKILISLGVASMVLFGATDANNTAKSSSVDNNKSAKVEQIPTFNLEDIAGNKIEIAQTNDGLEYKSFKDKNTILFFYLYDGAPCQGQLATFKEIAKDKKDLEIVTIELKGLDKDALAKYTKEKGLDFHMVTGKSAMDFVNYIAYRAKWRGTVPFIIVTDKKGAVKHIQIGAMNKEQLNKVLDSLNK
jgi:peroxiredoxin